MAQKTQMQKTRAACTNANNAGLAFTHANIQHWMDHGDWEPLAYLMVNHPQKSVLRRVVRHCLVDGITFEADKKSKHGVTFTKPSQIKQTQITTDKFAHLTAMVSGRRGINSKIVHQQKSVNEVNHYFPVITKKDEKTDKEKLAAAAARTVKWCEDNGFSLSQLLAAAQAKPTNEVKETMPHSEKPSTDFSDKADKPLSRGQKAAATRKKNAEARAAN